MLNAIKNRHSVREYLEKPIEKSLVFALQQEINACNSESGLNIQLVLNEEKAFSGLMAKYGKFSGVTNYIALIGSGKNLFERCGYYGERLVLKAQSLGLNTCWVYLTYKKVPSAIKLEKGEKFVLVIALGYGKTQGKPRKSKTVSQVSNASDKTPEWFNKGVECALLAPTAMNQQKFKILYDNGNVTFKKGLGVCTSIDLGIIKYHFDLFKPL
ncbi:MAG: nitroreductase [Clostridia bacterium]|nr:nitroreductase [Clostridia bacterium]